MLDCNFPVGEINPHRRHHYWGETTHNRHRQVAARVCHDGNLQPLVFFFCLAENDRCDVPNGVGGAHLDGDAISGCPRARLFKALLKRIRQDVWILKGDYLAC